MDIYEVIKTRRSIRHYLERPIDNKSIKKILEAAICAPSGKNCQPWKFSVVNNSNDINLISKLSKNYSWMRKAKSLIIVYLDQNLSYHYVKDVQSCGAAIQNMLLQAHSLEIGSCWVGDVIDKGDEIKELIGIDDSALEVMGVITLGYSDIHSDIIKRRMIESFMVYGVRSI